MKDVKNIDRVRKWQEEQKSKGLCIECSNPASGLRCDACNIRRAKNRKKKYQEWKEHGLCCQCGKQTIVGKTVCETHYLKQVSYDRLGTAKYWRDLKDLVIKQDFKCALTGDEMSFEKGMELDHIITKKINGKDELLNVQWVTSKANRFKGASTQEELLEICKKIVSTLTTKV